MFSPWKPKPFRFRSAGLTEWVNDVNNVNSVYPGEFGCGSGRKCESGYTCTHLRSGAGPFAAGFDNIAAALLTIFQIITLSDWDFIMYRTVDATGGCRLPAEGTHHPLIRI